jgi:hypothetical protein
MRIYDMRPEYFPKIISHRGNIDGPNPCRENHPDYIKAALNKGYGVEIDAWFVDGQWGLGHDEPLYAVNLQYFFDLRNHSVKVNGGPFDIRRHPLVWIHLKNLGAVQEMKNVNTSCASDKSAPGEDEYTAMNRRIAERLNYFWHQADDVTITNHGHFWVHPKVEEIPVGSAWVVPEYTASKAAGVNYNYGNPNWTRAEWVCVDYANEVKNFYDEMIQK